MWRRLATGALLLALLAAAPASAREVTFLRVGKPMPGSEVPRVIDEYKRTVVLRGVNVNGLVDYWDADPASPPPPEKLRPPYPTDPARYAGGRCPKNNPRVEGVPFCRADIGRMRGLGYSAIRLQLSWSLIEPQPDRIDEQYLDRIAQVVAWAKRRGIHVVLEMHQEAWSKYVYTRGETCTGPFRRVRGFDGAPRWASQYGFPACALRGEREVDPAVAEQFQKFWSNADGLQDHYTNVLVALADRFKDEPAVAGYELMNEPQLGSDAPPGQAEATELFPYWGRAVNAVVARVPGFRQLFFVQPSIDRAEADSRDAPLRPWSTYSSYKHVVYAPHVYRGLFNPGQKVATERFQPMALGYAAVQEDARALGLALWIGEFGTAPGDDDPQLAEHYALQDYYTLSGAFRSWKANDVGPGESWSLFDPPFGSGAPRESRIRHTARATPIAVAGNLQFVSYAPRRKRLEVHGSSGARIRCHDRKHATVVFAPRGTDVRVKHARMKTFKRAGGHDVYVFPDGGGQYKIVSGSGRKRTCPKN